jgi:hypothetical protein
MASRFGDAEGLGFACGKRSGITVLDVDTPDERLLADALDAHGPSPIIVRSGSGNFQAWYRYNGEGRRIRPDRSKPIDVLGGGFVVAPPSRGSHSPYSLIAGTLDDLGALPVLRSSQAPAVAPIALQDGKKIDRGKRNQSLWRACMRAARDCPNVEELMGFAMQANREIFYEPLPDEEVLCIVTSAWMKEQRGENWFGRGGRIIIPHGQIDELLSTNPDAFILLMILRRNHWGREFFCANAMAETMPGGGWPVKRLSAARRKLEEIGELRVIRPPSAKHGPAVYRFKDGQK